MNRTHIEWVKNPDGTQGYTWNPITGCLNHDGGMCKGGGFPCYAYKLAHGRLRERYLTNDNIPDGKDWQAAKDPFYPRFWPERICDWGIMEFNTDRMKPRGIFVCDMSDLFGDWLPIRWIHSVLYAIQKTPQHRFYLLTKQPQNLIKFSPFPNNCWVGVTATSQDMYDSAVYHLRQIQATVTYISIEPFLSPIHLPNYKDVDWLIFGSQTKPYKPPEFSWLDEAVRVAVKVGTPVFLKNNLMPLVGIALGRENYLNLVLNNDGELRQEMPK